jgi:ABC-type amino acid transport substrate-binding protein
MTEQPDYARSRAILIGTARYRDKKFPPLPAAGNSLAALREVLVARDLCGWPPDRVTVLPDPTDVPRLAQALRRLARDTEDVLLVYFVGHGVILRRGQLCLVLSDTDAEDPDITGLEFQRLREILLDSPARVKIVMLDCCYSGRAIETLAGEQLADYVDTSGVYTLTASDHVAHVVPLEQQQSNATSFTGEFVNLIRAGVPESSEWLTLGRLYPHLRRRLDRRGLPTPNRRGTDTVDEFPFARNAAYRPEPEPVPPPPVSPVVPGPVPPPATPLSRLPSRRVWFSSALAAVVAGILISVMVIWDPFDADGAQSSPSSPYPVAESVELNSPVFENMKRRGRVVVGVRNDMPGVSFKDDTTGAYSGFDIEIAKLVAAGLGFGTDQITFRPVAPESRVREISSGTVDLLIATYRITEARSSEVSFAGPYYAAGQDLLVQRSHSSVDENWLHGKKVCAMRGSTSFVVISNMGTDVLPEDTFSRCVERLLFGEVDAVTGDDITLRGLAATAPDELEVVGEPFTEEPYGIGLSRDDTELRDAVNDILQRALDDNTWREIYDDTLGASGPPARTPTLVR